MKCDTIVFRVDRRASLPGSDRWRGDDRRAEFGGPGSARTPVSEVRVHEQVAQDEHPGKTTPRKKAKPKPTPKKGPPKPATRAAGPDGAETPWQEAAVIAAAERWAREAPPTRVRRVAEARPTSWLSVEMPYTDRYMPPAHGLYFLMHRSDQELVDRDEVDAFWWGVLGDDPELLDDEDATRLFVATVRKVHAERVAARRAG
jgi:hypothetical protein